MASFSRTRPFAGVRFSPLLDEVARMDRGEVLARMGATADGLSDREAARRLEETGPNVVAEDKGHRWPMRLLTAARNPLVVLLSILAVISFATRDLWAGLVMTLMVILGVFLRFIQEVSADAAAARLKAMITTTAAVVRNAPAREIPIAELVPGDVVMLAAGDMIPADVRIIASKDLFISQGALTGESLPVEKVETPEGRPGVAPLDFANTCYLGTSVESGAATAVVIVTGPETYFGSMAGSLREKVPETAFDKGTRRFTWLMIRFMVVMVPLVFVINGLTRHDWREAFFFSIAVAVGLTPEMLPMIVSVCLSKGAIAMSKRKVIVKQLPAIQSFGAMDILCTDKTGTLTMDAVVLEKYCDVMQKEDPDVLFDALLISHFQTGLHNVLDRAVLRHADAHEERISGYQKVDEVPFDFSRRMMSVVIKKPGGDHQLLTKGAPEAVFPRCKFYDLDGEVHSFEGERVAELTSHYEALSADGFRVLAVAHKHLDSRALMTKEDENELILKGYLAFLDPPKDSAAKAIKALQEHGITVKVLTGDNDLVTRTVCAQVGLEHHAMLVGGEIEAMSDEALAAQVETTHLYARLLPAHKQRIIAALQKKGHVVGFLGDGINDSLALHTADVGVSVDSAVDIAKAAASVILLEKDLMVLDAGVVEGRKVFVNILKYLRMGASSNFGNMFSVVGASAFLPFIPMLPIQILTNNLLYDFSQVPIPTDRVSEETIARPRPWNLGEIQKFVLLIGPVSSIFDYTTFFVMLYVFNCWDPANASLFHTGWFVESLVTQTLIIHVIRTHKLPFIQSRCSWQLGLSTAVVIALAIWLPYSPVASALKLVALPPLYWPILLLTVICYVAATQLVKSWLLRRQA